MSEKNSLFSVLKEGLFKRNPTFVMVLGMCPTLAVTTSAFNGLGMGLSVTFVLAFSSMLISLFRNFIPNQVRIPAFIVIIASFSSIVQMLLKAYVPALDKALGIFIPLIVVNCIILERGESFASKNGIAASVMDAVGTGLGFAMALTIIGTIREILGNGSWFGFSLVPAGTPVMLGFIMAPGGFITLGLILGTIAALRNRKEKKVS